MQEHPVSFRVLSSLDVRVGADSTKIAAPRPRALLAQLLLNANQTVSTSALIDGMWGGQPPQHPESALHVVVCRLRRALGELAPRLVRDAPGYRIELDPEELDFLRARLRAQEADAAMRAGDAARASALFDDALACWTGEPLAELATFPFYDLATTRLRQLQLGYVEARNAAYLRCGRHLDVLKDVDEWIEIEPWRERLRAHQMVALYRSDRQIEALAAYEELRRLLVNDFGVEPHADLQRLQGRILRRDPTLLANRLDVQSREQPLSSVNVIDLTTQSERRERLREITLDPADVVMVEGGPGVEKSWLVAEVRSGATDHAFDRGDTLRRVSLTDWLAETN
jgi:DNA-binding SARP family transcriptional activator